MKNIEEHGESWEILKVEDMSTINIVHVDAEGEGET